MCGPLACVPLTVLLPVLQAAAAGSLPPSLCPGPSGGVAVVLDHNLDTFPKLLPICPHPALPRWAPGSCVLLSLGLPHLVTSPPQLDVRSLQVGPGLSPRGARVTE